MQVQGVEHELPAMERQVGLHDLAVSKAWLGGGIVGTTTRRKKS